MCIWDGPYQFHEENTNSEPQHKKAYLKKKKNKSFGDNQAACALRYTFFYTQYFYLKSNESENSDDVQSISQLLADKRF